MTEHDQEIIRRIVNEECQRVIHAHLVGLTTGCLCPIVSALAELQTGVELLVKGQTTVERSQLPDDYDAPWRESLRDDE